MDEHFKTIIRINQSLEDKYGLLLTEDDIKIIRFLNENTKSPSRDFLEISGPIYFISQMLDELDLNGDSIPQNLKMAAFLYMYVNTYELILHYIDRRLFRYLKINESKININKRDKDIKNKFYDVSRKKRHEHATPSILNNLFRIVLQENVDDSILGNESNSKNFRNKISHSNLFYDSHKNTIIALDGSEYTVETITLHHYRQLLFLIKWLEVSINAPLTEANVVSMMIEETQGAFYENSKKFKKYQRYGYQEVFGNLLISIKNKANSDSGMD